VLRSPRPPCTAASIRGTTRFRANFTTIAAAWHCRDRRSSNSPLLRSQRPAHHCDVARTSLTFASPKPKIPHSTPSRNNKSNVSGWQGGDYEAVEVFARRLGWRCRSRGRRPCNLSALRPPPICRRKVVLGSKTPAGSCLRTLPPSFAEPEKSRLSNSATSSARSADGMRETLVPEFGKRLSTPASFVRYLSIILFRIIHARNQRVKPPCVLARKGGSGRCMTQSLRIRRLLVTTISWRGPGNSG
jgi:hypothetical protein